MKHIFMSHSHADKPFVRRLAKDLLAEGHAVWIDEAELDIGDSLIGKISQALNKIDYVAAVISNNSINSKWVIAELELAINRQIEEGRIIILPILIDNVKLPYFLQGKVYADFRYENLYNKSLEKLNRKLSPSVFNSGVYEYRNYISDEERVNAIVNRVANELVFPAHHYSYSNKDEIMRSAFCGCFYCLSIYPPSEIEEWAGRDGKLAICPKCGIDSVLGSETGIPLTEAFLKKMKKEWFES